MIKPGVTEISDADQLVSDPLVSVLMITYNHEAYLAEAIRGVVEQQCNFPFELIIGEDASSDGTLNVAVEYQKRFPKIIRVVHSITNAGMNENGKRVFDLARGKYVSYCEGDDFWCAHDKLARQVEIIERDERVGIVHSDWIKTRSVRGEWVHDFRKSVHRRVPLRLLEGDLFPTWHFPKILRTCTVLLRRDTVQELVRSGLAKSEYHFGDSVLNAFVTSQFKVAYLPKITAVYRISPNSALRSGSKARVDFYRSALQFDSDARRYFEGRARYRSGFRWDSAAGLLVWGLRARDFRAVLDALSDFTRHFTLLEFIRTGISTCALRIPRRRRQSREASDTQVGRVG
jgi:glycosyltransferase involved in cell wall biosynthesis